MPHADQNSHSDSSFRVMAPAETDSWKAFDLGHDTDRLSYEAYPILQNKEHLTQPMHTGCGSHQYRGILLSFAEQQQDYQAHQRTGESRLDG